MYASGYSHRFCRCTWDADEYWNFRLRTCAEYDTLYLGESALTFASASPLLHWQLAFRTFSMMCSVVNFPVAIHDSCQASTKKFEALLASVAVFFLFCTNCTYCCLFAWHAHFSVLKCTAHGLLVTNDCVCWLFRAGFLTPLLADRWPKRSQDIVSNTHPLIHFFPLLFTSPDKCAISYCVEKRVML